MANRSLFASLVMCVQGTRKGRPIIPFNDVVKKDIMGCVVIGNIVVNRLSGKGELTVDP